MDLSIRVKIVKAFGKSSNGVGGGGITVNGVILPCFFKLELSSFAYLLINH